MTNTTHYIVLPHVSITGANAISSPITHGFPSITAFIGLMWALQRKVGRTHLSDVAFHGVGVVCHKHSEQSLPYWAGTGTGMIRSFCQSRNPLTSKGEIAPIIEEGRTNLDVSLIFSVECPRWLSLEKAGITRDLQKIRDLLMTMRAAGGVMFERSDIPASLTRPWAVKHMPDRAGNEDAFSELRYALSPGFGLVSRHQYLLDTVSNEACAEDERSPSGFDVIMAACRRDWKYCPDTKKWVQNGESVRKSWIVPIPVGFAGLSRPAGPGKLDGVRDPTLRHHFVESVFSLGEWVQPFKISSIEDLIWSSSPGEPDGVFVCKNNYEASFKTAQ